MLSAFVEAVEAALHPFSNCACSRSLEVAQKSHPLRVHDGDEIERSSVTVKKLPGAENEKEPALAGCMMAGVVARLVGASLGTAVLHLLRDASSVLPVRQDVADLAQAVFALLLRFKVVQTEARKTLCGGLFLGSAKVSGSVRRDDLIPCFVGRVGGQCYLRGERNEDERVRSVGAVAPAVGFDGCALMRFRRSCLSRRCLRISGVGWSPRSDSGSTQERLARVYFTQDQIALSPLSSASALGGQYRSGEPERFRGT